MASPTFNGTATTAGNAAGTSLVLNKPSSTAVGEYLVMEFTLENIGDTITAPSGWSLLFEIQQNGAGTPYRFFCYYREVDGSEGATFTWSWSTSAHRSGAMWRVGGGLTGQSPWEADFDLVAAGAASTSPTADGITPVTIETLLMLMQADTGASGTVSGGPTERVDFNRVYLATEALATAAATGSRSVTIGASQWWVMGLYALMSVAPAVARLVPRTWPVRPVGPHRWQRE